MKRTNWLIVILARVLAGVLFISGVAVVRAATSQNWPGPGGNRGMMGGYGLGGMMSGLTQPYGAAPLKAQDAKQAVQAYLNTLGNPDLKLDEVMVFSNNAYARIVEKSTGTGAFEVLVDPATRSIYPEPGPNPMWNAKYGMMGGGTMNGYQGQTRFTDSDAVKAAQAFLDANLPGARANAKPDRFYGYWTVDLQKDGKTAGMLSVNGVTGQVWPHTWHGQFIEMSEGD